MTSGVPSAREPGVLGGKRRACKLDRHVAVAQQLFRALGDGDPDRAEPGQFAAVPAERGAARPRDAPGQGRSLRSRTISAISMRPTRPALRSPDLVSPSPLPFPIQAGELRRHHLTCKN